MTRPKWLLAAAAAAFAAWLGYLGYAVWFHRTTPPDIVSRSQLVAAGCVVVAEVSADGGTPAPTVTVKHRLSGSGPAVGTTVTVANLPQARPPSNGPFPGPGEYLLPLVDDGPDAYRIAGWPRGMGESTVEPGQKLRRPDDDKPGDPPQVRPPLVYPWTDAVQKQMRKLGYQW